MTCISLNTNQNNLLRIYNAYFLLKTDFYDNFTLIERYRLCVY